jgi:putative flavoprotein involved in K+ transport
MMHEVAIIGAGQSGLALARCLQRVGIKPTLFDRSPSPGHSWRARYESLRLFTPAQYCSLPDAPFPGGFDTYPSKDAVADYLDRYAETYRLDVRANQRVERVALSTGGFVLAIAGGGYAHARSVAVTGGSLSEPNRPPFAHALAGELQHLHSSQYRSPDQIGGRRVLIVGAGNSGAQIAEELSATHDVSLSFEGLPRQLPQRLLGKDIFWWLIGLGILDRETRQGRNALQTVGQIPLIGSGVSAALGAGRIRRRRRAVAASEIGVTFSDGHSEKPDCVIWATGFRPSFDMFAFDVRAATGHLDQERGVSRIPGLFFIGVPGQHTKASAFLGFVGRDAEYLAERIARHLDNGRHAEGAAA